MDPSNLIVALGMAENMFTTFVGEMGTEQVNFVSLVLARAAAVATAFDAKHMASNAVKQP